MILDLSHVRHDRCESCDRGDGDGIEQIVGLGDIVFNVTRDAVVQHGEVEAEVEACCLLPFQVGVLHG